MAAADNMATIFQGMIPDVTTEESQITRPRSPFSKPPFTQESDSDLPAINAGKA